MNEGPGIKTPQAELEDLLVDLYPNPTELRKLLKRYNFQDVVDKLPSADQVTAERYAHEVVDTLQRRRQIPNLVRTLASEWPRRRSDLTRLERILAAEPPPDRQGAWSLIAKALERSYPRRSGRMGLFELAGLTYREDVETSLAEASVSDVVALLQAACTDNPKDRYLADLLSLVRDGISGELTGDATARLDRISIALASEHGLSAITELEHLLDRGLSPSEEARARLLLVTACLGQGKTEPALEQLNALDTQQLDEDGRSRAATYLVQLGQIEGAESLVEGIRSVDADAVRVACRIAAGRVPEELPDRLWVRLTAVAELTRQGSLQRALRLLLAMDGDGEASLCQTMLGAATWILDRTAYDHPLPAHPLSPDEVREAVVLCEQLVARDLDGAPAPIRERFIHARDAYYLTIQDLLRVEEHVPHIAMDGSTPDSVPMELPPGAGPLRELMVEVGRLAAHLPQEALAKWQAAERSVRQRPLARMVQSVAIQQAGEPRAAAAEALRYHEGFPTPGSAWLAARCALHEEVRDTRTAWRLLQDDRRKLVEVLLARADAASHHDLQAAADNYERALVHPDLPDSSRPGVLLQLAGICSAEVDCAKEPIVHGRPSGATHFRAPI